MINTLCNIFHQILAKIIWYVKTTWMFNKKKFNLWLVVYFYYVFTHSHIWSWIAHLLWYKYIHTRVFCHKHKLDKKLFRFCISLCSSLLQILEGFEKLVDFHFLPQSSSNHSIKILTISMGRKILKSNCIYSMS
jgi:hypothetical protein